MISQNHSKLFYILQKFSIKILFPEYFFEASMDSALIDENNSQSYDSMATQCNQHSELDRFTKYSPLTTLLIMTIGPLMNLVQITCETVDMLQVSIRYKNDPTSNAMNLYGFCNVIVQTSIYAGLAFFQIITCYVPKFIGERRHDTATQFTADCYRGSFLFFSIFPFGFYFALKPFLKFVGCPPELFQEAIEFTLWPIFGMFVVVFFNLTIGFFLAIGQSGYSAMTRILANVLQSCIYTPVLLFAIKCTTKWIRSSMIFSQVTILSIIIPLIFCGKFSIKPTLRMLIRPFTKEFPKSLLTGFPVLITFICIALPPTLILKQLTTSVVDKAKEIASVFAVFNRLSSYCAGTPQIFFYSFITCGSEAYGSKNYKRLFSYFGWAILLSTCVVLCFEPLIVLKSDVIAGIFLYTDKEIEIAKILLPIPFYTLFLQPLENACNAFLIVIGKPLYAMFCSTMQMLCLTVGSQILPKIFKEDPYKVMSVYPLTDLILLVVYGVMMIPPLIRIRREMKNIDLLSMSTVNINSKYESVF
ncbi:hypothetical protein TRFO_23194 [Tritrichomonas foetus]|uniref:MatE family protein n=1 Tax=Tritrichomonas foetus TaxID=1144522 RepID=A0A1J4KA97_9EUKA|nr:hypothetical protein TRFO_23194 [Tritrichomonas foetus]|eukprot:OHT08361.1 hypothetical protein TRFO_23194 [Tritrichomonas foetus]